MIWWKVYFWVYTIMMVIGIIGLLTLASSLTVADWISLILNIALCLGLYAYVFNKKDILETKWWTIIFWANIVLITEWLLNTYILNGAIENALPFLKSGLPLSDFDIIGSVVLSLPALYATYLLGNIKGLAAKTKKK